MTFRQLLDLKKSVVYFSTQQHPLQHLPWFGHGMKMRLQWKLFLAQVTTSHLHAYRILDHSLALYQLVARSHVKYLEPLHSLDSFLMFL